MHQAVNRTSDLIADGRERLLITARDPGQQAINSGYTGPSVPWRCHCRRIRNLHASTAILPYSHGYLTSHQ